MRNIIKRTLASFILIMMLVMPLTVVAMEAVNLNTASVVELQTIKGVGPKTAQKIVAFRDQHGQFATVGDLCNVPGIGKKTLADMGNTVCVE